MKIEGSRDFFYPRDVNVMLKVLFSTYSIKFAVIWNRCINHKLLRFFWFPCGNWHDDMASEYMAITKFLKVADGLKEERVLYL